MKFCSVIIKTSLILRIFFITATDCILQRIGKKVKSKTKKYAKNYRFRDKSFLEWLMIFIYINKIIYQYKYIFIYNGIVFVHYVMKLQLGILSWKFIMWLYLNTEQDVWQVISLPHIFYFFFQLQSCVILSKACASCRNFKFPPKCLVRGGVCVIIINKCG